MRQRTPDPLVTQVTQRESVARLFDLPILISLIASLLYISGWTFAQIYFEKFQLGLLALEIPKEFIFQYGFWVIQDFFWLASFPYIFCILAFYTHRRLSSSARHQKWSYLLLHIALAGFALVIFWGVSELSELAAVSRFQQQKKAGYDLYPSIQVELKADKENVKKKTFDLDSLREGNYRLLLQSKENLYLFYPLEDDPELLLPTLIIPLNEVHSMLILPQEKL